MGKRVLLMSIYAYPKIGGVENSLNYIAKNLKKKHIDCEILALSNLQNIKSIDGILIEGVDLKIGRIPLFGIVIFLNKLIKIINSYLETNKFDEVWCRNYLFAYALSKTNYQGKINFIYPTIAKLNSLGLYQKSKKQNFISLTKDKILQITDFLIHPWVEKNVYKNSNINNIFFSDFLCELAVNEYGDSLNNFVILPGIDFKIYQKVGLKPLTDGFNINFKY